jgi:uncharacterized membrane-anchored protein
MHLKNKMRNLLLILALATIFSCNKNNSYKAEELTVENKKNIALMKKQFRENNRSRDDIKEMAKLIKKYNLKVSPPGTPAAKKFETVEEFKKHLAERHSRKKIIKQSFLKLIHPIE